MPRGTPCARRARARRPGPPGRRRAPLTWRSGGHCRSGARRRPPAPRATIARPRGAGYGDPMSTDTRLWHPFADMAAVRGAEIVITRGEGTRVWDADGNATSTRPRACGASTSATAAQEIADAAAAQMSSWRATRRSARSPTSPRSRSPSGSPTMPTASSTTRASSSGSAAATRSTPPPSSRGATSRPAASRSHAPDRPHAGLPRHARPRHQHRGDHRQPGGHGPARPGHEPRPARLASRRWRPSSRGSGRAASRPSSPSL